MMSDSTPHDDRDGIVRSPSEIAAEEELPPSLPSDSEHSPIHDQLTAPMGSYKMTYAQQVDNDDDDSFSESDVDDRRKSETSDGGDDEKSVHLSKYASDEAVSYVESCESFDRYTDSSDEEESEEDNVKGAGGVCRRRQSNSDSETDDDSEKEKETKAKSTSKSSSRDDAISAISGNASSKMNNLTEVTEKKSSDNFVGIWDDDGSNRKESSKPARKLWSDYVYKPEAKKARGQMRAGARFTNSFTDKRQTEPVDQSWNMNQCNRFPPQLGMGLGRGLVPNNNMQYDPNNMRQPGPSRSYQQQRRPNNPYCHYQQQQRYFGMPRGSYASVVQKGAAANQGRVDSRNTNSTKPHGRNNPGNEKRFPREQQSYSRQNQNFQQSPNRQNQNYQHQRPSGQGPQRQQQQIYNRGTVTATQILQQQRMQQSQKQQPNGPQRGHPQGQHSREPAGNQENRPSWQPPKGPHVRHIMIGTQQVYLIQPSYNRRPIAEEDPAIVRAEPPVPPPYVMLPGGIPLALPMPIRGNFGANPGGQIKNGGSGGMPSYSGVNQQPTAVN